MGNKGPLKGLNGTKLILDDDGNNLDLFEISLESFGSFRGPLLQKLVTGQELFFAISYNKPALRVNCPNIYTVPFGGPVSFFFPEGQISSKLGTMKSPLS